MAEIYLSMHILYTAYGNLWPMIATSGLSECSRRVVSKNFAFVPSDLT